MIVAASFITIAGNAQISLSINIGTQPAWGPTGYDHVDYYYLPDIGAYYYVPGQVYYFQNGNNWVSSATLPPRYRNFDLYHAHKVVINNVDKPYLRNANYVKQYASYRGRHDQTPIRDSKEPKYFESKGHPQHAQWVKSHGNGHDNGHDNHHH